VYRAPWWVWLLVAVAGFVGLGVLYVTAPIPMLTTALAPVAEQVRKLLALATDEVGRAAALYPLLKAAQPDTMKYPRAHAAALFASDSHESGGLYADAYNYYDGAGKLHTGLRRAGREPTWNHTGKWSDPYAVGLCQIISKNRRAWGISDEDAFDPAVNLQAWIGHASAEHWRRIQAGMPEADLVTQAALLYMGQGGGGGAMDLAISVLQGGGSWSDAGAAVRARWPNQGLRYGNMWSSAQAAPSWLARILVWDPDDGTAAPDAPPADEEATS
jgi:hypothetical protein